MSSTLCLLLGLLAALPAPAAGATPGEGARLSLAPLLAREQAALQAADTPPDDCVELLYFHATLRCATCLAMEAGIERCLEDEFAVERAEGWLHWKSLDYQDAGNRALCERLGIHGNELVIVRRAGGERVDWAMIPGVWQAPNAAAICDSLIPIAAASLRDYLEAQVDPAP